MFMLGSTRTAPAPVATDKVIPMNYFDNTLIFRTFVLCSLFVFDAQLDPNKLRSSLERLVQREGWNRLGSRLRKNASGGLELHIPSSFGPHRPSIAYSESLHDSMPISEHALASRMPKPTTRPAVLGDPSEFLDLAYGSDGPRRLDAYLYSDRPQLGLHIVTFADATLVGLYWSHSAFDAMAKKALMEAWVLTLQDRDDDVRTPHAWDYDPLAELGTNAKQDHVLAAKRVQGLDMLAFAARALVDVFLRRKESRTVCIPGAYLAKLRETALQELAGNSAPADRWVSEGDVLLAVWARGTLAHLPSNSNKTLAIQLAYNQRKVLREDLIPKDSIYLGNCVGFICVLLTASNVLQNPISHTALEIRRAIIAQNTREHAEAYCATVRENNANRLMPVFGGASMQMMSISNWAQADLFAVDFGAARVDGNTSSPCHPRYLQNMQVGPLNYPEGYIIIGKDEHGNYWGGGCRVAGRWAKVEDEFAKIKLY